jgi:DNA-binding MarR family transcriptional regulator/GNAT superfamily N-acetyltransferase
MGGDVARVRSFNRAVSERVGALQQEYLARERSLGASRVLWEIGVDGTEVRALRHRLGLDSGYLSRLLRGLERERLVVVEVDQADSRIRVARLTETGVAERALLDRRSDELAGSVLAPLGETQRRRLVGAMGVVERLLTAGLVDVTIENPASAAAAFCFRSYFAELDTRFETGFDPTLSNPADVAELVEPQGVLLVAWLRHEPVGCGALKFGNGGHAEIKRMWVTQSVRGLGVGRRLLSELERVATRRGVAALRLETNRALGEAIGLYRSAGYAEREAFNDERYAHHWFEKHL